MAVLECEGQDDGEPRDGLMIKGKELIEVPRETEEACNSTYGSENKEDDVPQLEQMQSNNYDKDYTSGEM